MRFLLLVIGVVAYHSASTNSQDFVYPDDTRYFPALHNNQRRAVNNTVLETTQVDPERAVRKGINHFAFNLFQVVAEQYKGNLIFSPLSLSNVLGMVAQGTGGPTERDLERVLGLPNNSSTTQIGFPNITFTINYMNRDIDQTGNQIHVREGISLIPDFLGVTEHAFNAKAYRFNSNYTRAARSADIEIFRRTDGRMWRAVTADTFNRSSIVLLNTHFFRSFWRDRFNRKNTKKGTFYRGGVDSVSMDMMNMIVTDSMYGSLPRQNATFVTLNSRKWYHLKGPPAYIEPKEGVTYIILPNERNGMAALERTFGLIEPSELQGERYSVNITLPRFSINSSLDFEKPLQALGLNELFTNHADFSRVNYDSRFASVGIKQKAVMECFENRVLSAAVTVSSLNFDKPLPVSGLNELFTAHANFSRIKQNTFLKPFVKAAASAATTVTKLIHRTTRDSTPKRIEFKADHPFILVILSDGLPLAVARYNGPENP